MAIIAKDGGGTQRDLLPVGTQHAVCYGVVDLGHQEGPYGVKHECAVLFEFPNERYDSDDGKNLPKGKNKFYNITLHKDSNMGKDFTAWRGKPFTEQEKAGFDIANVIGANCLANITHGTKKDGTPKDDIGSITPLMANMTKLEPESEIINYSIADNGFDFEGIPEWIAKMVQKSLEYRKKDGTLKQDPPPQAPPPAQGDVDDIPF